MDRTKRVISTIAGFFLLWTLVCLIAAVAVCNIAGDRVLLSGEMLRYAPPQVSGLPEAEYSEMGRMIADYLTGRRQDFQYTYKDEDEKEITCFQPHEAAHMADCRGLIRTAGTLRWILAAAALVFFAVGIFLRESRKKFAAGIVAGFAAVAAVFLAVLLWGLVNFDGLFITFHKVLFNNDGWLLDPKTDMLIRLMPTQFFVSMGVRVLLAIAAAALAPFSAARTIQLAMEKKEQQEAHDAKTAVPET